MTDVPEIHYVRSSDGTTIAYQVSGQGPVDLLFASGGFSIDLLWDDPGFQRFSRRLESFARIIWVQGRGWGASEGDSKDLYVGEITDSDINTVLDAEKLDRAPIAGWSGSSHGPIHFSVTHPQRVSALILIESWAHYVKEADYPWGIPRRSLDGFAASLREMWGSGEDISITAPGRAGEGFRTSFARSRRVTMGPDSIADNFKRSLDLDIRHLLPAISAPTLVLHREGDRFIHPGAGRYLAEHIEGAKFVLLPGDEHLYFAGDTDAILEEIEEFLTGARHAPETDRVLATVLFTDIVGSTERAGQLGDRRWRELLDSHDRTVRRQLERFRGREVDNAGDGFLATFDGPGRAIECACAIRDAVRALGIEIRVGLHTGEIEVRGDDVAGMAVHIGARVAALASANEVLVSRTVTDLVAGSGIEFSDCGKHELKGVPGTWRLYAVVS